MARKRKVCPGQMNSRDKAYKLNLSKYLLALVSCLIGNKKQNKKNKKRFSKNSYFEVGYKLVNIIENKVKIISQLKFVSKIYARHSKQLPNRSQICFQASIATKRKVWNWFWDLWCSNDIKMHVIQEMHRFLH